MKSPKSAFLFLLSSSAANNKEGGRLGLFLGSVHSFQQQRFRISSSSSSSVHHPSSSLRRSTPPPPPPMNAAGGVRAGVVGLGLSLGGGSLVSAATIGALRGGGGLTAAAVSSALSSGPLGVGSLGLIASCVVAPLTLYRQAYSFSVGYGFSVFAMALSLLGVFWKGSLSPLAASLAASAASDGVAPWALAHGRAAPLFVVSALVFYGFRLGSFLLVREWTVESKKKQLKTFDKSPPLKSIPLSASVSLFYAFLVTPALYSCRRVAESSGNPPLGLASASVALYGAVLSWVGAIAEAVTDYQKFAAKRGNDDNPKFTGPTGGLYNLSRHPNYLGEILFWLGVFVSGLPSFGKNPAAYVCSSLGLFGILRIMLGATNRLDKKQEEKYGGQALYEEWKKRVPKLFPETIADTAKWIPAKVLLGFGALASIELVKAIATRFP